MSYAMAAALQAAIYQRLSGDAALAALVADAIYDAMPAGPVPETYVSLGPEQVRDGSAGGAAGAWHRFTVAVISTAQGFATAKAVAGAVTDALLSGAPPALDRGRVVGLWFDRAEAERSGDDGAERRIALRFRARLEDS